MQFMLSMIVLNKIRNLTLVLINLLINCYISGWAELRQNQVAHDAIFEAVINLKNWGREEILLKNPVNHTTSFYFNLSIFRCLL